VSSASAHASVWRGWRRRVLIAESRAAAGPDSPPDAAAWAGAALDELAQRHPIAGLPLRVQLADSLVHCDIAHGDFAGCSDRRLAAFASVATSEMLGDAAGATLRWQLQRDERHLLVCAAPDTLVRHIVDAATRCRLRLRSIEPSFVGLWNRWLTTDLAPSCVVAFASQTNAVVACVRRGVITTLANGPWNSGTRDPGVFDMHVDRLLAGVGFEAEADLGHVLVHVGREPPPASERWKVVAGTRRPEVAS
jgi:hypothetical protein